MTKNLKLAIVLLVTVASMNVNAQKKATTKTTKPATENKTAKPTKQETMDWIAGKMKERLLAPRTFVSYSDGKFVYIKQSLGYDFKNTLDLNKITGSASEYSSDYYVKGSGLVFTEWGKESNETKNELAIGGPNYSDYISPFDFKNDDALVERLKKAFATLIEYNSKQKGADEKF